MKVTMKLTLQGMVRALRIRAHDAAEAARTTRQQAPKGARKERRDAGRP